MVSFWSAKYKCLKCSYEWKGLGGPIQTPICGHINKPRQCHICGGMVETICPRCNNVYVKWLDYEEQVKFHKVRKEKD